MEKMYGTYLGFMFSDESAVGTGEFKVVIDDQHLAVSVATGLDLVEQVLDMADAQPIDSAELTAMFTEGLDVYDMHGIRFPDGTVVATIALPEDTVLVLGGQPGYEAFGPTTAIKADADGMSEKFEDAVKALERSYNEQGSFPRVTTGGRAPRYVA